MKYVSSLFKVMGYEVASYDQTPCNVDEEEFEITHEMMTRRSSGGFPG